MKHPILSWIALAGSILAIALLWILLPVGDWIRAVERTILELGAWGPVLLAATYVIGALLLIPGVPLTLAAALVLGWWALPLVLAAATTAACLAFLIARHALSPVVRARLERRPRLRAIDRAVAAEGWKTVLLIRLSPLMPFALQNYLFGVTRVGFWPFAGATLPGILPGTTFYVHLGAMGQADAAGEADLWQWLLFAIGLATTGFAILLIARRARSGLDRAGIG